LQRSSAQSFRRGPLGDDVIQSDKGTAGNEQDVGRVDADELLLGMFSPAFLRHVAAGAFDELQERLLHPFAGHVSSQ
jgi:hypothetical protein